MSIEWRTFRSAGGRPMTGTILEGEEFPCAGRGTQDPMGGVPYAVATCRARVSGEGRSHRPPLEKETSKEAR